MLTYKARDSEGLSLAIKCINLVMLGVVKALYWEILIV